MGDTMVLRLAAPGAIAALAVLLLACAGGGAPAAAPTVGVRTDLSDSGAIRRFADIRGRTLGLSAPSSGMAIDMSRASQEGGISGGDVNGATLSFPDRVPALANGAIGVSGVAEPV